MLALISAYTAVSRAASITIGDRFHHAGGGETGLGAVVIAEEQTAGQGRHGHTWHSEAGDGHLLLASCSAGARRSPWRWAWRRAEAIAQATGLACDLRWPNDLMLGRQESGRHPGAGRGWEGHGRHRHQRESHARSRPNWPLDATSLRLEAGRPHSRAKKSSWPCCPPWTRLLEFDQESVLRLFTHASSYAAGRRVTVRQPDGVIEGVTAGLTRTDSWWCARTMEPIP